MPNDSNLTTSSTKTADQLAEDSILQEVSREELNELFSRDPENLTKEDIQKIVPFYRRRYSAHAKAERDKQNKPKRKKAAPSKVSLGDLGL